MDWISAFIQIPLPTDNLRVKILDSELFMCKYKELLHYNI